MKKLMCAVAAMAAGVALSGDSITSANVVGYETKSDTRAQLNFITPTFRSVSGNLTIQAIQLDTSVSDLGAVLQRLDDGAAMAYQYYWYTIAGAKSEGWITGTDYDSLNGVWLEKYTEGTGKKKKTKYRIPTGEDAIVETGDGFQVQLPSSSNSFNFNGQVGEDDMLQKSRTGFNYIGNCYPANCTLQDFQLDTTVADLGANLQRLDDGAAMAYQYYWYTIAGAKSEGWITGTDYDDLNGVWLEKYTEGTGKKKKTKFRIPEGDDRLVTGGSALQVQMPAANLDMIVLAPYDL